MNDRERFDEAVEAILRDPRLADLHPDVARAREDLAGDPNPLGTLMLRGGAAARLIWLQVIGHLRASERLPIREALELPARAIPTVRPAPEAPRAPDAAVTFMFLADPQPSGSAPDDGNLGVSQISRVSALVNVLSDVTWPVGYGLSCAGEKIGPIDSLFFGGDLCQTGGGYNMWDQAVYSPAEYHGGWELEFMRYVFDPQFEPVELWWSPLVIPQPFHTDATRTTLQRVYWGLGNHDIQSTDVPGVRWSMGCLEFEPVADYWRAQMWNFIAQMHGVARHRGPWTFFDCVSWAAGPRYPVTAIDADDNGLEDWTERSFNYRVDLGPVDVYQLHNYGGDSEHGRADGLAWLRDQLARGGTTRPVIVVQHLTFQSGDGWPAGRRDALLDLLRQYNVIAVLTGHDHGPLNPIPKPAMGEDKVQNAIDECRPGSARLERFAVVRVSPDTFDIMQGLRGDLDAAPQLVSWEAGYGKRIAQATWDWGYTAFASATQEGAVYVWAYHADKGHVAILRVADGGAGFTQTNFSDLWDRRYTSFAGFELEGRAYVWAYREGDGTVGIERIDGGGAGFTQTFLYGWDTKYTGFAACPDPRDGNVYVWAYSAGTGLVNILRVLRGGAGFEPTYGPRLWCGGYTAFARLALAGGAYLWAYNATTGRVCILAIDSGGSGFTRTATRIWDGGFTSFASFELDGRAYVWAYRSADALVCIFEVLRGGSDFVQRSIWRWRHGYEAFTGFNPPAPDIPPACVWAYSAADGRVAIERVIKDGTEFVQLT